MTTPLRLIIGNKNLSSWSLRPWLALSHPGIPFEEHTVAYELEDWHERVRRFSPTARVPVLEHGALRVWESIAICEYVAELFPEAKLWPANREARAVARTLSAEIHAGFADLRNECSMNIVKRFPRKTESEGVQKDVRRVDSMIHEARRQYGDGGPFLFGTFSIADAMLAPITTRIVTYDLDVAEETRAYVETIITLPAMVRWRRGAEEEVARNPNTVGKSGPGKPAV
jgi:glutathione S-transferase